MDDPLVIDYLIQNHQGLIRHIAKRHCHAPKHYEYNDLVAYGQIGLLLAARAFKIAINHCPFGTFAYKYVLGNIYLGIWKMIYQTKSHKEIKFESVPNDLLDNIEEFNYHRRGKFTINGSRTVQYRADRTDSSKKW